MVAGIGVVAGDDEDCVLKPRLSTCCFKEASQRHVGIAYALVYLDAFLWIDIFVFLGYGVRMMARCGEDSCHERLFHLRHLRSIVLQKRLVPDSPCPIEVIVTSEALIFVEVLTSVVFLKANALGESHESHGTALCSVEEGCLVAFGCQQRCYAINVVH